METLSTRDWLGGHATARCEFDFARAFRRAEHERGAFSAGGVYLAKEEPPLIGLLRVFWLKGYQDDEVE